MDATALTAEMRQMAEQAWKVASEAIAMEDAELSDQIRSWSTSARRFEAMGETKLARLYALAASGGMEILTRRSEAEQRAAVTAGN